MKEDECSLQLFQHPHEDKHLVVIHPDLEVWVLKEAEQASVDPKDYFLPNNARELHLIGKKKRTQFHDFVAALYQAEAFGIVRLSGWLESS